MTPSALRAAIKRKKKRIHILQCEVVGLERDLLAALPRKEARVTWGDDDYKFEIQTKRGWKPIPTLHAWTSAYDLQVWLRGNNITHVVSVFGEHTTSDECIADGVYTVKEYLKWWSRQERNE